jgi:PAS domain S-box-containing protein
MNNASQADDRAGMDDRNPYFEAVHELPCGALAILDWADGAYTLVDANRQFLKVCSAPPVAVAGTPLSEVVQNLEQTGFLDILDHVRQYRQPMQRPVLIYNNGKLAGWRDARVFKLPQSGLLACALPQVDRFRKIVDNLSCYLGLFTKDGVMIDVNSTPLEEAGMAREDVVGKPIWEAPWFNHDPANRERLQQIFARAAAGEVVEAEMPLRIHDGKLATFQGTVSPIRDDKGDIVLIAGFGVDVTERINAVEDLRNSEKLFRLFIDNTPLPIALKSVDGRFLLANRAQSMHGHMKDSSDCGGTSFDYFPPEQAALAAAHDKQVIDKKDVVTEERQVGLDKDKRDMLVTKFPIFDGDGDVAQIGVIGTDITETKRADEAIRLHEQRIRHLELNLARLERVNSLGTMLSGLAHELNQPLAALQVYANRLLAMSEDWPEPPAGVVDTLGEMQRLTNLAHRIMLRLRGSVEPKFTEPALINCSDAVAEVLEMVRPEIAEAGIDIRFDPPSGDIPVMANTIDLQLILSNIVRNSKEALMVAEGPGGSCIRIDIQVENEEDMVCVSVADNGPGMDNQTKNLVFTPFYTTKPTGMGLGLSMAQRLAEGMGGYIKIFDNSPRGVVFHLCLPRSAP